MFKKSSPKEMQSHGKTLASSGQLLIRNFTPSKGLHIADLVVTGKNLSFLGNTDEILLQISAYMHPYCSIPVQPYTNVGRIAELLSLRLLIRRSEV